MDRKIWLSAAGVALVVAAMAYGVWRAVSPPTHPSGPTGIDATCRTDATAGLDSYFSRLAPGTTVDLPAGACYLVSNSMASLLTIAGTRNVTVDGRGATFKQSAYPCGSNQTQPVLTLAGNTRLAITGITIQGAGAAGCSGSASEGDYGIMVRPESEAGIGAWVGNHGIAIDRSTIENTLGDGLAVYPDQATNTGINTDVAFQNSTLADIGYHGITVEGVIGLTIQHDKVSGIANFMDLEVDSGCGTTCYTSAGLPRGAAQWNVTVKDNTFTHGNGGNWVTEEEAACIPIRNWAFDDNTLDATVPPFIVTLGSDSTACPPAQGLSIAGNVSTDHASSGSPEEEMDIGYWEGVRITANSLTAWAGTPTYQPNKMSMTAVAVCQSSDVAITGNTFNNAAQVSDAGPCWGLPPGGDRAVTVCGNRHGLTEPIDVTGGVVPQPAPRADRTSC